MGKYCTYLCEVPATSVYKPNTYSPFLAQFRVMCL